MCSTLLIHLTAKCSGLGPVPLTECDERGYEHHPQRHLPREIRLDDQPQDNAVVSGASGTCLNV